LPSRALNDVVTPIRPPPAWRSRFSQHERLEPGRPAPARRCRWRGPDYALKSGSAAVDAHAKRAGFEVVAEFYDAAVSGADAIDARPGFSAMLRQIASNGVRTIIVETANRFARDLVVQETGCRMLLDKGITMIAADSPSASLDDGPTTTFVRQVLGAVAELDKAMTVAKLRGAGERVRRRDGKCEGRKSRVERAREAGGEVAARRSLR
jgi:DNA invertase Pin-like site-specific DNA recombinase